MEIKWAHCVSRIFGTLKLLESKVSVMHLDACVYGIAIQYNMYSSLSCSPRRASYLTLYMQFTYLLTGSIGLNKYIVDCLFPVLGFSDIPSVKPFLHHVAYKRGKKLCHGYPVRKLFRHSEHQRKGYFVHDAEANVFTHDLPTTKLWFFLKGLKHLTFTNFTNEEGLITFHVSGFPKGNGFTIILRCLVFWYCFVSENV